MSALLDSVRLAAAVAPRQAAKIKARADAIIAEEAGIETMTNAAFAPHEALLAEAREGLNEVQQALAVISNGGPPLPASGSSPAPQHTGS